MRITRVCCLLLLGLWTTIAQAEEITIAVASNFTATMKDIVDAFQQTTTHRVNIAFGSSGKFYAQIKQGAPFDAFFSADQAKPQLLESEQLGVAGSRFTYAVGALALWSAKPTLLDNQAAPLKNGAFNKLALANPQLAPYGIAAIEVLERLALRTATQPQWVQGENIAQTYQFVSTGNADIGFVALSQIMRQGHIQQGSAWIVPTAFYNPIKQDVILLQRAKHSEAAQALLHFIRSKQARDIIESYGYQSLTHHKINE